MKFPSIKAVAQELHQIHIKFAEGECDVRLQVYEDGAWAVRWGLSDYDQDHHGFWGASSIPGKGKRFRSEEVAKDLIAQCRDHHKARR